VERICAGFLLLFIEICIAVGAILIKRGLGSHYSVQPRHISFLEFLRKVWRWKG